MSRVQPAARAEPDQGQDVGDPVATLLRRRPVRAGTVLTQPPPPPPVPARVPETEDELSDLQLEAPPREEADVVADIDRLIAEVTEPPEG